MPNPTCSRRLNVTTSCFFGNARIRFESQTGCAPRWRHMSHRYSVVFLAGGQRHLQTPWPLLTASMRRCGISLSRGGGIRTPWRNSIIEIAQAVAPRRQSCSTK
ncbi:hypothetical protein CCHR01_04382 [Colletotrichum chrysophilum]|uniref:Uncharacterized protein n=1 Tax=Colletotrichum chrysophilum TaxID=1836956 RepID=A0AAD9ASK5_9PEZI|nr:hypothetical protein CCHR01_04382 [Colletotrichum chrysophilum]